MGIKMLEEESFEHPVLKQRHADELYIWRASEKFIDMLIADLNDFGYTGPVTESRSLKIVEADRVHLTHRFGIQGEGKIPIDQLTGRALLVMSDKLLQNYLSGAPEYLSRQESMALFAYMIEDWDVAKSTRQKIEGKFFQELWSRISVPERRN